MREISEKAARDDVEIDLALHNRQNEVEFAHLPPLDPVVGKGAPKRFVGGKEQFFPEPRFVRRRHPENKRRRVARTAFLGFRFVFGKDVPRQSRNGGTRFGVVFRKGRRGGCARRARGRRQSGLLRDRRTVRRLHVRREALRSRVRIERSARRCKEKREEKRNGGTMRRAGATNGSGATKEAHGSKSVRVAGRSAVEISGRVAREPKNRRRTPSTNINAA